MNKKIILIGAIVSTIILLLTPNVVSINTFQVKEQIFYIKNVEINNIEHSERVVDRDCNCDNSDYPTLCLLLFVTYFSLLSIYWICSVFINYYHRFPFYYLSRLMDNAVDIATRLNCDWLTPYIENN